jgi:hypothetical protein
MCLLGYRLFATGIRDRLCHAPGVVAPEALDDAELDELMRREEISKTQLAIRMKTSRAQLDRLLDPENKSAKMYLRMVEAQRTASRRSSEVPPAVGEAVDIMVDCHGRRCHFGVGIARRH